MIVRGVMVLQPGHIDIKTIYTCACYGEELQKRLNLLKIRILRHMFKPLTCSNEGHPSSEAHGLKSYLQRPYYLIGFLI